MLIMIAVLTAVTHKNTLVFLLLKFLEEKKRNNSSYEF